MMIKLEFSEQHVQVIADVLVRQPYATVAPIIDELKKQLTAQLPQVPAHGANGQSVADKPLQ